MRQALILSLAMAVTGLSAAAAAHPEQDRTRHALDSPLPEIHLENVALIDAVEFLRDASGANIHVNWAALEEHGVTQAAPVTLRLRGVTLRRLLSLILADAGAAGIATFHLDDDVILITTRELADRQLILRTYFVDDLIHEVPDFLPGGGERSGPRVVGSRASRDGGGELGVAVGGGVSYTWQRQGSRTSQTYRTVREELAAELIGLIQAVILPDIWRENGGPASIRYYNGYLIVTAPRSVHEAIGGPLE